MKTKSDVRPLITAARRELERAFGTRLRAIYLYGSYARGNAGDASDVDLLVVLDRVDSYYAEIERTSELRSRLSLEYDVTLSMVYVSEADWRESDTPFLASVRQEARAA